MKRSLRLARALPFTMALLVVAGTMLVGPPAASGQSAAGFTAPTDKWAGEQWSLFNFGQKIADREAGTANVDIKAPEAWSITVGDPSVVVAVIDTGLDLTHPDIKGNLWTNPGETGTDAQGRDKRSNGVDDDSNGYVDDWRGWDFASGDNDPTDLPSRNVADQSAAEPMPHGTAVASLIAAERSAVGMSGIAPGVRVMPLKVFGSGTKGLPFEPAVIAAIDYAAKNGAKVVNLSIVAGPLGSLKKAAERIEQTPDVLFVAAAGNDGQDAATAIGVDFCRREIANLICVAATDENDRLAQWTGEPKGSNFGQTVHIGAPGAKMLVAAPAREEIHRETFEDALAARWAQCQPGPALSSPCPAPADSRAWSVVSDQARSGKGSLAPFGGGQFVAGTTSIRTTQPIQLRGSNCFVELDARDTLGGRGTANVIAEIAVTRRDSTSTFWAPTAGLNAFGVQSNSNPKAGEWKHYWIHIDDPNAVAVGIGFRVAVGANDAPTGGVWIDNVAVTCESVTHGEDDLRYAQGTSFATPLVSGTAALVYSKYPRLNSVQVKTAILEGAVPNPNLVGKTSSGKRLDAHGALLAAANSNSGGVSVVPAPPTVAPTTAVGRPGGGYIPDFLKPLVAQLVPGFRPAEPNPRAANGVPARADEPDNFRPSVVDESAVEAVRDSSGRIIGYLIVGTGVVVLTVAGAAKLIVENKRAVQGVGDALTVDGALVVGAGLAAGPGGVGVDTLGAGIMAAGSGVNTAATLSQPVADGADAVGGAMLEAGGELVGDSSVEKVGREVKDAGIDATRAHDVSNQVDVAKAAAGKLVDKGVGKVFENSALSDGLSESAAKAGGSVLGEVGQNLTQQGIDGLAANDPNLPKPK